ncbi:MAG: DUF4255 domain-containing protein [Crocinitomicaceae bacterium]|nr:DUF4255 domain-containing protein [Crocinitomicaceae bacterium]
MIDHTVNFLTEYLNTELQLFFGLDEDKVVMGNLVDPNGESSNEVLNKVVVSLVSMEHVTNANYAKGGKKTLSIGGIAQNNDPVLLNLYIMVSANFESKQYHEALKMLSTVIGIFQTTNVFLRAAFPNIHPSMEKLSLEIVNLPLQEQIGVWNSLGAKYVPSILYKARVVTIDLQRIDNILPEIKGLASKNVKKNEE